MSEKSEVEQRAKDLVDMFHGEGIYFDQEQVQRIKNALYLSFLEGKHSTLRDQMKVLS